MSSGARAGLQVDVMGSGGVRLLFVHGFLDAGRIWDPVRRQLADAGIASAAVDLPGMGGTAGEPAELSLEGYAEAVAATVAALGRPVVLVGQSMGAPIVELAASRSPLVEGLVLLTPVPLGGVGMPPEMLAHFKSLGGDIVAQREQRVALSHALTGHMLDDLVALGAPVRPEVVVRLVDIWNDGHEAGSRPSSFGGPVIVIRGAADPFVTKGVAEATATRFPNAHTVAVDAAGHWTHVELPVQVGTLVLGFVVGLGAPRSKEGAGDWKAAFSRKTREAFASAFAEDIVLEASTLVAPVRGREAVQAVMAAASTVYASLEFGAQATEGRKQYVEWIATSHEGVEFAGVTVLTRNDLGEITHVAIHHRPMEAAIFFSKLMGGKLRDALPPGHFLPNEPATSGDDA